jgi:hypothetical protein
LTAKDAVVKNAQVMLSREECALSMEQRSNTNDAAVKGARIKFRRGEYAEDMEHTANPDESIAFASCFGSEFEKTTMTLPNRRNPVISMNKEHNLRRLPFVKRLHKDSTRSNSCG